MERVFISGDKHGDYKDVEEFLNRHSDIDRSDYLIILGDAGLNYYLDEKDREIKEFCSKLNITFLMVHGNHEERPYNIPGYKEKQLFGGTVFYQEEYDNIFFLKDGENYNINNHRYFVMGGADSLDKEIRVLVGFNWYESERPDKKIMKDVDDRIKKENGVFDIVLSHTCPYVFLKKYKLIPEHLRYMANLLDRTTEYWLSKVESRIKYNHWYFGHHHLDKRIDIDKTVLYNRFVEVK